MMQMPMDVSYRDVMRTVALDRLIRTQAGKLERVCDHIVSAHLAIERPQRHQRSGSPFRVRLDVRVPPGHEVVVTREPGEGDLHDPLTTVVRTVFSRAERRLRSLVEEQHGEVKRHRVE
jgi:hypothetical protein